MSEFPDLRQPSAFDPTIKVGQTTPNLPTDPQPVRETAKIAELQAQLAALTWTEITPENLPKIGDELFAHHVFRVAQWDTVSSVTNIHATWRVDDFLNCGWTHFRPINPPPPSSAKGGDDGKSN